MYQMAFFGKMDIYALKNTQIGNLWMLKIHIHSVFCIMPFSRFE